MGWGRKHRRILGSSDNFTHSAACLLSHVTYIQSVHVILTLVRLVESSHPHPQSHPAYFGLKHSLQSSAAPTVIGCFTTSQESVRSSVSIKVYLEEFLFFYSEH